jgi:mono/diheme cytochrome c family protein
MSKGKLLRPIGLETRWHASAGLLLLLACAGGGQIPVATQVDADRAAATGRPTTLAELEQGRSIYLKRCSGCHRPVEPASVLPEVWPSQVAKMKERAHLEPQEEPLVLLYLVTLAVPAAK